MIKRFSGKKTIVLAIAALLICSFAVAAYAVNQLAIRPTTGVYTNANGYFFMSGPPSPTPAPMGDETVIGYVIDEREEYAEKVIFYFKPAEIRDVVGNIEGIYVNDDPTNIYQAVINPLTGSTDFGYAVFDYEGAGDYIHIDTLVINAPGHPTLTDVYLSVEN
jgi:hypothetical protein